MKTKIKFRHSLSDLANYLHQTPQLSYKQILYFLREQQKPLLKRIDELEAELASLRPIKDCES